MKRNSIIKLLICAAGIVSIFGIVILVHAQATAIGECGPTQGCGGNYFGAPGECAQVASYDCPSGYVPAGGAAECVDKDTYTQTCFNDTPNVTWPCTVNVEQCVQAKTQPPSCSDPKAGQQCTSPANSCGMTTTGTYDCNDNYCSATTAPSNSLCPITIPPICSCDAKGKNCNADCGAASTNSCAVTTPTCINPGQSDAYCTDVVSQAPAVDGNWGPWSNPSENCGTRTCNGASCGGTCAGSASSSCATPIDGKCSDVAGVCAAGTAINKNTTSCSTTWSCQGTDGGKTVSCSPITAAPVDGTWDCTTGLCVGSSCNGTCPGTEAEACAVVTPPPPTPPTCAADYGKSCGVTTQTCNGNPVAGAYNCQGVCISLQDPCIPQQGEPPSYWQPSSYDSPFKTWCVLGGEATFTAYAYTTPASQVDNSPVDVTDAKTTQWYINPPSVAQSANPNPLSSGPSQDVSLGDGKFACNAYGADNSIASDWNYVKSENRPTFNVAGVVPTCPSSVKAGATAQCTVVVYTSNGKVENTAGWSVPPGDGTINATGLYTAPSVIPSSPEAVTITATSLVGANISQTVNINVISNVTQSCGGDGQVCCTGSTCTDSSLSCQPDDTCGSGSGGNTATLTAQPTSGPAPLSTTLKATITGTVVGSTINYSFWWDCPYNNDVTVASATADCGVLPTSGTNAVGAKYNGVASSITTQSVSNTYTLPQVYHPIVIIETGVPAIEAHTTVTATASGQTPPIQTNPPSVTNPVGSPLPTPITVTGGCSAVYTWTVSPSTGVTAPSWTSASFDPTFTFPGTYQVTVKDSCGNPATSVVTITQPSCSFTANPTTITPPQSSNLEWYCLNATSCTLDDDQGNNIPIQSTVTGNILTGNKAVSPSKTTIYTLTCSGGPHDSITQTSSIGVSGPGIIETNP